MVLRLRQHNIDYTADGFYRSDDPTNSVKALKEGGSFSSPIYNTVHVVYTCTTNTTPQSYVSKQTGKKIKPPGV